MTTSNESCAHRLAATPELIGKRSLWAYVAALWAFAFAVLHIAWAAGFYLGLQEGPARVQELIDLVLEALAAQGFSVGADLPA